MNEEEQEKQDKEKNKDMTPKHTQRTSYSLIKEGSRYRTNIRDHFINFLIYEI